MITQSKHTMKSLLIPVLYNDWVPLSTQEREGRQDGQGFSSRRNKCKGMCKDAETQKNMQW